MIAPMTRALPRPVSAASCCPRCGSREITFGQVRRLNVHGRRVCYLCPPCGWTGEEPELFQPAMLASNPQLPPLAAKTLRAAGFDPDAVEDVLCDDQALDWTAHDLCCLEEAWRGDHDGDFIAELAERVLGKSLLLPDETDRETRHAAALAQTLALVAAIEETP